MANDEIYMDIPAVLDMGKQFEGIGDMLKNVSNTLEISMTILKTTAYVGLVGGTAVERFLDWLKPIIDDLSEKSLELGNDLKLSAEAYERGDALGATRFH